MFHFQTVVGSLAMFFLASEFRCPTARLHDNSRVNTTDFLEHSKFVRIVRLLASCGRQGNRSAALWMEVETAFNSSAHELLTNPSNLIDLLVALDNDKCHHSCSANSDFCGLKRCRHVKDSQRTQQHFLHLMVSRFQLRGNANKTPPP